MPVQPDLIDRCPEGQPDTTDRFPGATDRFPDATDRKSDACPFCDRAPVHFQILPNGIRSWVCRCG